FSVEQTFETDLMCFEDAEYKLSDVFESFAVRWTRSQIPMSQIKGITLKLKFADFVQTTIESTFQGLPTYDDYARLLAARVGIGNWKAIRLIGVGVRLEVQP